MSGGLLANEKALRSILKHFPAQCNYAFAYGSGVFAQRNQKPGKMIDIVFVVDDPVGWHRENLRRNWRHYSILKYFGPKVIAKIQEEFASGVYYNPFVWVDKQLIKYGVISTSALEHDLTIWSKLYIAGRLHKPVLDLMGPGTKQLAECLKLNREMAIMAALLQEERFVRKFDLFHGIAELSYLGDSRMKVAESPQKTKNIVVPLMAEFEKIYVPLLDNLDPIVDEDEENDVWVQDVTPQARFKYLMSLPMPFQNRLCHKMNRDPRLYDVEEVMAELSYLPTIRHYIRLAITDVVYKSSVRQTIQGILSAGFIKSTRYAFQKLQKGILAKLKKKVPEEPCPYDPEPTPPFDPSKPIPPPEPYKKRPTVIFQIKSNTAEFKITKGDAGGGGKEDSGKEDEDKDQDKEILLKRKQGKV